MSQDIKALSHEWFEHVWNRKDRSAIDRLASQDVVSYGLGEDGRPAHGLDQFKRFHAMFISAFPDMKARVEDVLLDADKTAVRLSFTGTHLGDGIGIPPTGKTFNATAIVIFRWKSGKIVEAWNEFDAAGMLKQLQVPAARLCAD